MCNKWEEKGLLFSSGELTEAEERSFKDHLKECAECTEEYNAYLYCKNSYFTTTILSAQPSTACDAEILRVCADGRRKVLGMQPLSLVVKRTLVSLTLLIVGFVGVTYISVRMGTPSITNTAQTQSSTTTTTTIASSDSATKDISDSLADTAQVNPMNYARTRGNLDLKGVYPVELQNK